jgi:hypothetical protein
VNRNNSVTNWSTNTSKERSLSSWLVEALCYEPEGCGSIPDEVIGIFFNLPDPYSLTMALAKCGWCVSLTVSLPAVS